MILTADSPAYTYEELINFIQQKLIESIDMEWLKKHLSIPQAFEAMYILINNSKVFKQHEIFKWKGAKDWNSPKTASHFRKAAKKLAAKTRMILGGCLRQSPALQKALNKEHTFYREDGTVVKVSPQRSATDIYYILKEYYDTDAAVQGLCRLLRNGHGSFVGWTLTKPYDPNQKRLYTEVKNSHSLPIVDFSIYSDNELEEYDSNKTFACNVTEDIEDISPYVLPAKNPVKGGRILKAVLEKVMVLTKGNKTIVVKGAANLATISRQSGISLAALRHVVYQRCKTANGWTLSVFR